MKFVFTYQPTSWNAFYRPYYFVDGKRVTEQKFEYMKLLCRIKGLTYNTAFLQCRNNRYKSVFYYD